MKAAKTVATVIVLAVCAWLIDRTALIPWRVNEAKKSVEKVAIALVRSGNARGAVTTVLRNLERIDSYIRLTPHDVELYMLRGAYLRLLGRTDEAIGTYRAALDYDRRPEIYFNLGIVLLESGNRIEAVEALVIAVRFGEDYLKLISDPFIREEVARKADAVM